MGNSFVANRIDAEKQRLQDERNAKIAQFSEVLDKRNSSIANTAANAVVASTAQDAMGNVATQSQAQTDRIMQALAYNRELDFNELEAAQSAKRADQTLARIEASLEYSKLLEHDAASKYYDVARSGVMVAEYERQHKYYAWRDKGGNGQGLGDGGYNTYTITSLASSFGMETANELLTISDLATKSLNDKIYSASNPGFFADANKTVTYLSGFADIAENLPGFRFGSQSSFNPKVVGLPSNTWLLEPLASGKNMANTTLFEYKPGGSLTAAGELAGKGLAAVGVALSITEASSKLYAEYEDTGQIRSSSYVYNGTKVATDLAMTYIGVFGGPLGAGIAATYFVATSFGGDSIFNPWRSSTEEAFHKVIKND
ncbi:MAG: hypothetical protein ACI9LK_003128 [Chromatiales bacterium]